MRFYEYEAKALLRKQGIPLPKQGLGRSAAEAGSIACETGFPVVLKSQVLTGGRMKAGGIKFAASQREAEAATADILTLQINNQTPRGVLVEARVPIEAECYLGVTYDTLAKAPVAIFSTRGGINIEEVAQETPEKVAKAPFSALLPFSDYIVKQLVSSLGVTGRDLGALTSILCRLAQAFLVYDLTLAEINPLGRLADGSFVALDAHVDMEDEAIYRQGAILDELGMEKVRQTKQATPFELAAAEIDSSDHRGVAGRMVEFEGSLGLIIGGGGASLTAFDAITRRGGKPANYCEIGGNPSVSKVTRLTKLLLSKPGVEKIAVIMNVVNNTRVDLVARGIIKGVIEAGRDPAQTIAVFRIPGAWEEEGFRILDKYGVFHLDRTSSIDQAAQQALERTQ
ncbi:MAG: acetate--CoA ligase family protein [Chloroflexi bacterium]|nr:acetate--CoA ligase family protein [Chloroflexota bacterium]